MSVVQFSIMYYLQALQFSTFIPQHQGGELEYLLIFEPPPFTQ